MGEIRDCPTCGAQIKEVMKMKPRYEFDDPPRVVVRLNKFVLVVCENGHVTNRMMPEAYED